MQQRRIAMWSGPRNISTAMMRSWGSRSDTAVYDEPFYAHYLSHTGHDHPSGDEVMATYPTDWQEIVELLIGDIPDGKSVHYQKHMTHHMLGHIDKVWMLELTNCFLIRDPRRMILSFSKVIPNPTSEQMGLSQQVDIFNYIHEQTGEIPPVIAAKDVLCNPRETLSKLCDAIGVPFDPAMLEWEAGRRDTDGVWAKHWYKSVEQSTEFMPYREDDTPLPAHLQATYDACLPMYEQMAQFCIR